jgi:hypothetical protein
MCKEFIALLLIKKYLKKYNPKRVDEREYKVPEKRKMYNELINKKLLRQSLNKTRVIKPQKNYTANKKEKEETNKEKKSRKYAHTPPTIFYMMNAEEEIYMETTKKFSNPWPRKQRSISCISLLS